AGALPLLSAAERQQMLVGWNTTQTIYPKAQSVPEAIAAQAALTPEAVAVVAEAQQLTYRALEARANQLAQHLRTLGVRPEVRVGVCLERSLELVIALLGVIKAGGAYVPLDPTYPAERLTFMLHDAQVQVLLTHTPCAAAVPAVAVPVLWLDRDWSDVAQQP